MFPHLIKVAFARLFVKHNFYCLRQIRLRLWHKLSPYTHRHPSTVFFFAGILFHKHFNLNVNQPPSLPFLSPSTVLIFIKATGSYGNTKAVANWKYESKCDWMALWFSPRCCAGGRKGTQSRCNAMRLLITSLLFNFKVISDLGSELGMLGGKRSGIQLETEQPSVCLGGSSHVWLIPRDLAV